MAEAVTVMPIDTALPIAARQGVATRGKLRRESRPPRRLRQLAEGGSIAVLPFRDLITRMFPLAEEAVKTLANFRSTVMAGLDQA